MVTVNCARHCKCESNSACPLPTSQEKCLRDPVIDDAPLEHLNNAFLTED